MAINWLFYRPTGLFQEIYRYTPVADRIHSGIIPLGVVYSLKFPSESDPFRTESFTKRMSSSQIGKIAVALNESWENRWVMLGPWVDAAPVPRKASHCADPA